MSMRRIHWDDLPLTARTAVEDRIGPVKEAVTASAGANSAIAAVLHADHGTVFVKGVPAGHPQARTQGREAAINAYLPAASPRLLWRVVAAGWDLIGYEHLNARHADYAPGSPDLPLVVVALAELQEQSCPGIPLKAAEQRWAAYAGGADTTPLGGPALLHTDLAPHNVLITGRAHLIDWAWPTRGAAWIDPAVIILRLMEAGHSAEGADTWARQFPSWTGAPHDAVALFSNAGAHAWKEIAYGDPRPWKRRMAHHASTWADYWQNR